MLSLAVATLAAGALCWPAEVGRSRLTELRRRGLRTQMAAAGRSWTARRCGLLPLALAAGIGALLAGPGGSLAAAMVTGTATARWRAGRDRRATATAATGLSDALGVLVAELRAGAHPGDAVRAAADTHADSPTEVSPNVPTDVFRALSAAAAAAALGGDVPAVLRSAGPASLRSWLGRLADAWSLADHYGIPLADLCEAVRSDTEHRVRFAAEVQARLAGPRATASVLAGLPLLGLALGHALGAAPLHVLCETPVGQVLLVIGTAAVCVGVQWSARLVSGAVPA
ncbi:MAG: type II secretion system F family protein [Pseudonocardiales bacterium]|nr:type II secretion system F family protein [Pseudonocardiales bacterium]MBV9030144.1 type II secretion system F family protein [Pseudonocardiales bacterium]MBW0010703.1 type II secretion system F family protein [Pseudonocardiales bacterium]